MIHIIFNSSILKTIITIRTSKHIQYHCHSELPPMVSHQHTHPFPLPFWHSARLSFPALLAVICGHVTEVWTMTGRLKWTAPCPGPVLHLLLLCLLARYLLPGGSPMVKMAESPSLWAPESLCEEPSPCSLSIRLCLSWKETSILLSHYLVIIQYTLSC